MIKKAIVLAVLIAAVFCMDVKAQSETIFPKGELSTTNNHTGKVWLTELNRADSTIDCNIANATFAPGAKLDWHIHPAGQILMITAGTGYYQEKGKPVQVVRKGDVIKCLPGITHWHGASPKSSLSYLAASTNSAKNKTVWLQKVTYAEYNNVK